MSVVIERQPILFSSRLAKHLLPIRSHALQPRPIRLCFRTQALPEVMDIR